MDVMKAIDGNKTYICTIIGGIFAVIHFMVTSDYSVAAFLQLGQDSAFLAMIAALRHGVSKVGNQGVVTMIPNSAPTPVATPVPTPGGSK